MAEICRLRSRLASLVGREDSPATAWDNHSEHLRWVGKPWRRIELLTHRHYWNGEQTEVDRTLTMHLGRKRGGLSATLALSLDGYDYSEERP